MKVVYSYFILKVDSYLIHNILCCLHFRVNMEAAWCHKIEDFEHTAAELKFVTVAAICLDRVPYLKLC